MAEKMTPQGLVVGLFVEPEEVKLPPVATPVETPVETPVDLPDFLLAEETKLPAEIKIAQISVAHVGGKLSIDGALPSGVSYQWMKSKSPFGAFENISGAVEGTYKPTEADKGYFVKCAVSLNDQKVSTKAKKVS